MRKELKLRRHTNANKHTYWRRNCSVMKWWDGIVCPQGLQTAVGKIPLSVHACTVVFSDREPVQGKPTYYYPISFLRTGSYGLVYKNSPKHRSFRGFMTSELRTWLNDRFTFHERVPKILWVGVYWYDD